jgi:hypothetical protein
MAGLSKLVAKELSTALGITDNPKFNPMFRDVPEGLDRFDVEDPDNPAIARFYSPVESAIENAPISETKGTKGENIEAFVRKRAPKVTKGELEFRDFKLDPESRYTTDQAMKDAMIDPMEVVALRKPKKYQGSQRQLDLKDKEVGYEEVGVDVANKNLGLMTHYGSSNIAHTRYSFRQTLGEDGDLSSIRFDQDPDYILIEELQSDAIQNISSDASNSIKKATDEYKKEFKSAIEDIAFKPEFDYPGTVLEDFEDFVFNKYLPIRINKKLSSQEQDEAVQNIFKDAGLPDEIAKSKKANLIAINDYFDLLTRTKLNVFDFDGKDSILKLIMEDANDVIYKAKRVVDKKETPLTSLTDSVRVLLQSIIADAKSKNVDEIVLPPIEKLAARRFGVNNDDYKKAISKGSGFHNTYVVAYDKAVKQLKSELGNQIKLGTKKLKYKPFINLKDKQMALSFPNGSIAKEVAAKEKAYEVFNAKTINIKDLKIDPAKTELRFNTGGLVQRPNK